MVQTSFSFFFSSSLFYHRLVTIISILLLNPLPFIYAAPTEKTNINSKIPRQKREVYFHNDDLLINKDIFSPKDEIIFQGLLGLIHFDHSWWTKFYRIYIQVANTISIYAIKMKPVLMVSLTRKVIYRSIFATQQKRGCMLSFYTAYGCKWNVW